MGMPRCFPLARPDVPKSSAANKLACIDRSNFALSSVCCLEVNFPPNCVDITGIFTYHMPIVLRHLDLRTSE